MGMRKIRKYMENINMDLCIQIAKYLKWIISETKSIQHYKANWVKT
jgi:hypothetical protein